LSTVYVKSANSKAGGCCIVEDINQQRGAIAAMSDTISHEIMEDEVHVFTLVQGGRQAIDDVFALVEKVIYDSPDDIQIRMLFDTSKTEDLPMRYTMQKAEQWKKIQTELRATRSAIVTSQQTLVLAVLNLLMASFNSPESKTKLFTPDKWDEAMAWLKVDDEG
jgi:hypothetical protein